MNSTLKKLDNLIMGQSMKDEVKKIFLEYANRKPLIVFENVGLNPMPNYHKNYSKPISFDLQLSGLNIKVTPENYAIINTMHASYKKDCKVSIYLELMK